MISSAIFRKVVLTAIEIEITAHMLMTTKIMRMALKNVVL